MIQAWSKWDFSCFLNHIAMTKNNQLSYQVDLNTIILVWVEMPCWLLQVERFILRLVTTHHLCEHFFWWRQRWHSWNSGNMYCSATSSFYQIIFSAFWGLYQSTAASYNRKCYFYTIFIITIPRDAEFQTCFTILYISVESKLVETMNS